MKRPLTILLIAVLTIVLIYACGTIPTANTSFVTITIGDTPYIARLKAESATPWARFKYYLADAKLMPEAYAYIPSVVQVIVVTVTATDITTPIVGVMNIAATDTVASLRIEVPNGSARQFTVEGIRGVNNTTYYRGTASADLNGADINLPVSMNFVGPGIWVSPTGNDTGGTGTQANPYLTISKALSTSTGTDAILVSAGTYTLTVGAAPSTLQLKPKNALICLGTGFTTVIDASNTVSDLIYGDEGASIDNCKLIPGSDTTAIDDRIGGAGTPTRIKINGLLIDANPATGGALDGIILSADSLVLETTILNTTFHGISVLNGKPEIRSSTISQNPTGIDISGGDPLITGNTIDQNNFGINISISTGAPVVNANNIFCNLSWGVDVSSGTPINLKDNAWNRDATTTVPGPIVNSGNCFAGDDICVRNIAPDYIPFRAAAPGGCVFVP
jgi:hypothetical protein